MAVNLSFIGGAGWQFFDDNGDPLAGGKIFTYVGGTTTPLTTYTSYTGLVANTNPIILDAAGRTPQQIWTTEGVLYKYVIKTADDVLIRTWDNIGEIIVPDVFPQNLANTSDPAKGDALVGFRQSNSSGNLLGSVGKTLHEKMQDIVSVRDFGAVGNGTTNDTEAFTNFAALSNNGVNKSIPGGTYKVSNRTQKVVDGYSFTNSLDFLADKVKTIGDDTPLGNCYITRDDTRPGFAVGQVQGNRAIEFVFDKDVDGLYIIDLVYYGDLYPINTTGFINATNFKNNAGVGIPNPLTVSGDNAYLSAAEVGYTFEIPFTGTGLIFRYFADTRGGLWKIIVDGDTANPVFVSTWRNPGKSNNSQIIFKGLSSGSHTAVFEFMGADPNNAPTTGGPRGWLKFDNGITPTITTAIGYSNDLYEMDWLSKTLMGSKILEFAIQATKTGSGIPVDWVPSHSNNLGATVVTSTALYIDGLLITADLDTYPTTSKAISSFVLEQKYTAYSSFDLSKQFPLWNGILTHKFSGEALVVTHKFTTLTNITLGNAYSASIAGRGTAFSADNGTVETLVLGDDAQSSPGYTKSVAFTDPTDNSVFAMSIESLNEAISVGAPWQAIEPTYLVTRTSDAKLYYRLANTGAEIPSGQTFTLVSKYAVKASQTA